MIKTKTVSTCDVCGFTQEGYMNIYTLKNELSGEGSLFDVCDECAGKVDFIKTPKSKIVDYFNLGKLLSKIKSP